MTTANQLNLDSLDRKPCATGAYHAAAGAGFPTHRVEPECTPVWRTEARNEAVG
jgi:hypothetical protein